MVPDIEVTRNEPYSVSAYKISICVCVNWLKLKFVKTFNN